MYNKDYCNITRRIYISDLPLVKTLSRLMQNGVDFWLSLLPLCRESSEIKVGRQRTKVSIAWMDSRLPVKTSQALAEHVVTHHFPFSTSTNVFELCEGNILIRFNSSSVNEDRSTSMVDTSINEVEKDCPWHALVLCPYGWMKFILKG